MPNTLTNSPPWFAVSNEAGLPTPALLLIRERIESNLQQMMAVAGGTQRLRPHVKTHKLGPLVQWQRALGITKFKCATLAEAEMLAQADAPDVLLAFPAVGTAAAQLVALATAFPNTTFSVAMDDLPACQHLGVCAARTGHSLGVWLDVDCGMGRTGVPPGPRAAALYAELSTTPGLRVRGLHAYDGHVHESDPTVRQTQVETAFAPVQALRCALDQRGLAVPALVAGGSPTFAIHARSSDYECSPGTTVLWDFGYAE